MTEKTIIMVLDRVEEIYDADDNVIGMLVVDKDGKELKVKKGQGGKLQEKWDKLTEGTAFEFTMGMYTPPGKTESYPYVQDFRQVSDALAEQAKATTIPKPTQKGYKPNTDYKPKDYKADPAKIDSIEKQVALKCATEITVAYVRSAGGEDGTIKNADKFYNWLKGGDSEEKAKKTASFKEEEKNEELGIRPEQLEELKGYDKALLDSTIQRFKWKIARYSDLTYAQALQLLITMKQKGV